MQEFFQLIAELIGLHGADPFKHTAIACKISVLCQQAVQMLIVKPVQLKSEKHQRSAEIGDFYLQITHEFGALAICGQLIVAQACIGHDAAADRVNFFLPLHAGQQRLGAKRSKLAFVIGGKALAFFFQPGQIAFQLGGIGVRVKIAEVPLRQTSQIRVGGAGCGIGGGKIQLKHILTFGCLAFRYGAAVGFARR